MSGDSTFNRRRGVLDIISQMIQIIHVVCDGPDGKEKLQGLGAPLSAPVIETTAASGTGGRPTTGARDMDGNQMKILWRQNKRRPPAELTP